MIRDKAAHHEKILAAAREEFRQYGFPDASMRRIAAAAGMSAAGLYRHFPGKEEMFSALVEPACAALLAVYRKEEAIEQDALREGNLVDRWELGGEVRRILDCIYDRQEDFFLLLCRSRGTRYESFLQDLAAEDEKATLAMVRQLQENGVPVHMPDPQELHLLMNASVDAIFRVVELGMTRDKAMRYADTLDAFLTAGWRAVLGY